MTTKEKARLKELERKDKAWKKRVRELRRYGSAAEVLSPQWLRNEFAAEVMRMAKLY